jgi:diguanylate cyclase (GGDEF)-like protein
MIRFRIQSGSGFWKTRANLRSLIRHRFLLLGLILVAIIAGADWLIISMQRAASLEDFFTATTNLANGMAAQTARSIESIDRSLRAVQDRLAASPDQAGEGTRAMMRSQAMLDLIGHAGERLAGVLSLTLIDASGTVAVSTRAGLPAGRDMSGLEVFRHFASRYAHGEDGGAFVGAPRRDAETGQWTVFLARRIDDPRGKFAGAVLAQLALADLEDFYRTAMPADRTLLLARRDGTVLLVYPPDDHVVGRVVPANAPWRRAVAEGGGRYLSPGPFSDMPVLAVVRPLRGLPLVVQTSLTQARALESWRLQRINLIGGGILACALAVMLLRLFCMQMEKLAAKNRQLDEARGHLAVAMANISQGLCFFDGHHRLIVCNRRYRELYGLPEAATQPGTTLQEITDQCSTAADAAGLRDGYLAPGSTVGQSDEPYRSVVEMLDGRTIAIQQQPMPDGGWVATHEDITERRRAEDRITFLARHDVLTGLANRSMLQEDLAQARTGAARGSSFAVLFLDLDRFKAVNDTLGHAVGDELLRAVACRLQETVRKDDTVARLGGDEFVVVQVGLQGPDQATQLAHRIINAVSEPYRIGEHEVVIGVSIGIEIATNSRLSADDLLTRADMALYNAKREGRGTFRFYETEMNAEMRLG